MKHSTSFILGAVTGGLTIFTIAADSHRPTDWRYRVVQEDAKYSSCACFEEAIARSATNGWEFVSAQINPLGPPDIFGGSRLTIIQKQPKE